MGEITVEQIVSADGFAMDRQGGIGFFDAIDFGEQSRRDTEQMRWIDGVDAILFGRRTYEMFADYWPAIDPRDDAVAGPIGALPKFVVSRSLTRAPWGDDGDIEVLQHGPEAAARTVKERHRSIAIWGSLQLSDALFTAGLVDRLRLRQVPILLGQGRSIAPTVAHTALRLEHSVASAEGIVTSQYRVVGGGSARERDN